MSYRYPGGSIAWAIGTAASQSGAFINALAAHNFETAGNILMSIAEKKLSKAAFKELTKINLIVTIASAAVSCALE